MFEKILLVSEPLSNYDFVLKAVNSMQKLGTRECLLLRCLGFDEINETISTFIEAVYQENLEMQKRILIEQGLSVVVREAVGNIKEKANRIASEEGCSLMIAGASERTMLGEMIFGGAASQIMYGSCLPFLMVRIPAEPAQNKLETFQWDLTSHILFSTDFSETANKAFAYLKEMVTAGIRKVTLMHVQDRSRLDPYLLDRLDAFNETDMTRLQQMAAVLKNGCDVDVTIRLPYGLPTAEILKVIKEQQVSLVIMGSQGRGFVKEIFLGSVSNNIARHSAASVLLIPAVRE